MTRRPAEPANAVRMAVAVGLAGLAIVGAASFSVRTEAAQTPQGRPQNQQQQNVDGGDIKVLPVRENVFMLVGAGGNITVQVEPPKTLENHLAPYLAPREGILLVDTGL